MGKCMDKGSLIVSDLVVDDWVEVGDHCEVSKEHVDKGVVTLLVSFAPCAHAIVGRVKSEDEKGRYLEFCVSHAAVVT